jgi:hypothetical protein
MTSRDRCDFARGMDRKHASRVRLLLRRCACQADRVQLSQTQIATAGRQEAGTTYAPTITWVFESIGVPDG